MKRTIVALGVTAFFGVAGLTIGTAPTLAQPDGKGGSCSATPASDLVKCLQDSLDALWTKVGTLETEIGNLQGRVGKLETRVVKSCEFFGELSGNQPDVLLLYVPEDWTAKRCADYMLNLNRSRIYFTCVQFGPVTGPTPTGPYPNATRITKGPNPHVRGVPGSPFPHELPQGADNFCGWRTGT